MFDQFRQCETLKMNVVYKVQIFMFSFMAVQVVSAEKIFYWKYKTFGCEYDLCFDMEFNCAKIENIVKVTLNLDQKGTYRFTVWKFTNFSVAQN